MKIRSTHSRPLWRHETEHRKHATGESTTTTSVRNGTRHATIEIIIDEADLLDLLAPRAMRNSSHKATLAAGAITAYAIDIVDTKEGAE